MKTEELIRLERRQLFKRLNIIPWIFAVILAFMSGLFIKARIMDSEDIEDTEKIENIRKSFLEENINLDLAIWKTDSYGNITFEFRKDLSLNQHITGSIKSFEEERLTEDRLTDLQSLQVEAINLGIAKWVPDEYGNTKFKFKEKEELMDKSLLVMRDNHIALLEREKQALNVEIEKLKQQLLEFDNFVLTEEYNKLAKNSFGIDINKELKVRINNIIYNHLKRFNNQQNISTESIESLYEILSKDIENSIDDMFKIFKKKKFLGIL